MSNVTAFDHSQTGPTGRVSPTWWVVSAGWPMWMQEGLCDLICPSYWAP
jgi:hypothetical protein